MLFINKLVSSKLDLLLSDSCYSVIEMGFYRDIECQMLVIQVNCYMQNTSV